ncbi:class I SAM-dependent methyltransferase [Roseiconus lacunae]|uniref:class I SAM-dependent methyltransferase n=1 Tax=Roseiconus lacunae TaxID=2605694 RepID=UPI001E325319|nr:class I SAM-dependent methyltransferase [Roseiconus lacunae]MCD0458258.1 class I SAM-dependent methyltransferase [Roseiconus lacunae]
MKIRQSGMPEESMWREFFEPQTTLTRLGLNRQCVDVVEFGCGYGTFTIPAARIISGRVKAFDIDPIMIEATRSKTTAEGIDNVDVKLCDFVGNGTGLADESIDYVMLFNILHGEDPHELLYEAHRILRPNGIAGILHWNNDPATPRGPDMMIRPKPEQCRAWAIESHFHTDTLSPIIIPPYHYGWMMKKPKR